MRYTDAKCRLCRREGEKLYLKGARCLTPKCPVTKRGTPPGMHGKTRAKLTEYGKQLREKQKAKRIYGISEAQCMKYYDMASRAARSNIEFASILERRIDNIVYRSGLAASRAQARQLVSHGIFDFNDTKKVTIPSIVLRPGDTINVNLGKKTLAGFTGDLAVDRLPGWLEFDKKNLKITCIRKPEISDILDVGYDPQAILEFYSR